MAKKQRRPLRRQLIIEKGTQIYISFMILVYLIVYTIVMLLTMLAPSVIRFSRSTLPIEDRFLASQEFLLMDQRVVPIIIIIMVIMSIHFLFVTNRIFGPLYRLKNVLNDWRGGIWPKPFTPRSKDFNDDLFRAFNNTIEKTRGDVQSCRDHLNHAYKTLKEANLENMPEKSASDIKSAEDFCRQALEKLNFYHL